MKTFKEYLNEAMIDQTISSPQDLIIELLNSVSQIHIFHWLTKDANLHPRLGDLYEAIETEVDEIAESMIGSGLTFEGVKALPLTMSADPVFVDSFIRKVLNTVTVHIDAWKLEAELASVVEELIDIQEAIKSYLYFAQQC